jgi:epsilon-lactone hydrolase
VRTERACRHGGGTAATVHRMSNAACCGVCLRRAQLGLMRGETVASEQSQALSAHYRRSNAVAAMDPPLSLARMRDLDEHWGDVTAEPGGVNYIETEANGVRALWAEPHGATADRVLLCLHGGGFIGGSIYTHRKMFAHLAKSVGARALSVDYRRTPEYQYPAAHDDVVTAYYWLLDTAGIGAQHIAFAGDSAGAGLAVTTVLRAQADGRPLPAAVMMFSPWVDLAATAPSLVTNRDTDLLFGGATPMNGEALVSMLLPAGVDRTDPLVSPLYADLSGFPPAYVQVGGAEMLLDDARRFAEHAREAGVKVELDVFEEQQHTFQMMAGRAPEADEAIARLSQWVRPHLALADRGSEMEMRAR